MASRSREAVVKTILPALLVAFGYFTFTPWLGRRGEIVNPQAVRERTAQSLRAEQQRTPSVAQQAEKISRLLELTDQRDLLSQQHQELTSQWQTLKGRVTTPGNRTHAVQVLEEVLGDHGLRTITQTTETSDMGMPPRLRQVLQAVAENPADHGQMVKFTFRGKYPDVVKAIRALEHQPRLVFPIGLNMQEPESDDVAPMWVLFVWI